MLQKKTKGMNIIVSIEDLFDVSVLLKSAFEITSPSLMPHAHRLSALYLTADQITNKQIVDGLYLCVF